LAQAPDPVTEADKSNLTHCLLLDFAVAASSHELVGLALRCGAAQSLVAAHRYHGRAHVDVAACIGLRGRQDTEWQSGCVGDSEHILHRGLHVGVGGITWMTKAGCQAEGPTNTTSIPGTAQIASMLSTPRRLSICTATTMFW
jgi:hypothetical protein